MVPGMRWFLLWSVLVVGAAVFYAWIGLRLWRKGRALSREMSAASSPLLAAADALARAAGERRRKDVEDAVPVRPAQSHVIDAARQAVLRISHRQHHLPTRATAAYGTRVARRYAPATIVALRIAWPRMRGAPITLPPRAGLVFRLAGGQR